MNNSEQDPENSEVNNQPTGRKRNTAFGRKTRVRSRKAAPESPETNPEPLDGGTRLRNAVERRVGELSESIAKALVDKTIEGNMVGARLVTELSGAKTPRPKRPKLRTGPTVAERWAAQAQWVGPMEVDEKPNEEIDSPFGQPSASTLANQS